MTSKYLYESNVLSTTYHISFLLYEIKNNVSSQCDMEKNYIIMEFFLYN